MFPIPCAGVMCCRTIPARDAATHDRQTGHFPCPARRSTNDVRRNDPAHRTEVVIGPSSATPRAE